MSGGWPDTEYLERLNQIVPGFSEKLLEHFLERSRHRAKMEVESQKLHARQQERRFDLVKRGQWFGLIIGLAAIVAGSITAAVGSEWAGGAIGTGGVIGLVSVFVLRRAPWQRQHGAQDASSDALPALDNDARSSDDH